MSAQEAGRAAASTYEATDGAAYDIFLGRWTQQLAGPLLDFLAPPADGARSPRPPGRCGAKSRERVA